MRGPTLLFTLSFLLATSNLALAHGGRTDANGGHYNRKTGEYHYHNGGSSGSRVSAPSTSTTPSSTYVPLQNNAPPSGYRQLPTNANTFRQSTPRGPGMENAFEKGRAARERASVGANSNNAPSKAVFVGKVVSIIDGDTIGVMQDGKEVRVRLHGIDAPESGQPFGDKAKRRVSTEAFGKSVRVDVTDTDRYGRLVGEITLPNGRILNHVLVEAGLAWWYQEYAPGDTTLRNLHSKAKIAGLGLWVDREPIPPWEWRNGGANDALSSAQTALINPRAPPAQTYSPQPAVSTDTTVYVTRTGEKYHANGCQYLSKSKIPMGKGAAISQGYGACSRCRP